VTPKGERSADDLQKGEVILLTLMSQQATLSVASSVAAEIAGWE